MEECGYEGWMGEVLYRAGLVRVVLGVWEWLVRADEVGRNSG